VKPNEYSTYEAKARFSELMRLVREGRSVVITYHGKPVAELRPARTAEGLQSRIERLRATGRITGGGGPIGPLAPLVKRAGPTRRFLEERED
jgi:prevent-host-death family protein